MPQPLTTDLSRDSKQLVDAAAQLNASTFQTTDDAIDAVLQALGSLLSSRTLFLARFDTDDRQQRFLNILRVLDQDGCPLQPGLIVPLTTTYCSFVERARGPIIVEDVEQSPEFKALPITEALNIGSYVGVPLIYGNGDMYGTLCGLDPNPIEMESHPELVELMQILARMLISYIERDELNDKLNAALAREQAARGSAENADLKRRRFTALIAHELRTPLASIKGFTTTLLAEDLSFNDEQQREFLTIVDEEANQLNALIDQLFDATQMEVGAFNIKPQVETLTTLMGTARSRLGMLATEHALQISLTDEPLEVWADKGRIAQTLTNLVSNAAKFSPIGSPITLCVYRQGSEVRFDVGDQGPGIAPDQRQSVFDAYQQLDTPQHSGKKGIGLGLAICKGIVEAHGGSIWVDDRPAPGTTISFTLPLAT